MNKWEQNKKLNEVYALDNKRFEIIHARHNQETGKFDVFMHDEYLHQDIILSANTASELVEVTRQHIEKAGFSFEVKAVANA